MPVILFFYFSKDFVSCLTDEEKGRSLLQNHDQVNFLNLEVGVQTGAT